MTLTYPFVAAYHAYGARKGPALALAIHMAEGGGTVGYLSRDAARGVSVHFVIERTGRIVQMLDLAAASGSIDPTRIRTTDDADGFYGVSHAKRVLGDWWRDPNSAVISVEIEGYASIGPNAIQQDALADWAVDMRQKVPTLRGALGHRDFASYKACPGRRIDWTRIGGHGLWAEEDDTVTITRNRWERWKAVNGNGVLRRNPVRSEAPFVRLADGTEVFTEAEATTPDGNVWRLTEYGGKPAWLLRAGPGVEPGNDFAPLVPGGDPDLDRLRGAVKDDSLDSNAEFNAGVDAAVAAAQTARR